MGYWLSVLWALDLLEGFADALVHLGREAISRPPAWLTQGAYQVLLIDKAGRSSVFATYPKT